MCIAITGGDQEDRSLYSNKDIRELRVCAPLLLDGIGRFVKREDLLDRTDVLRLLRLDKKKARSEADIWADFDNVAGELVWLMMHVLARALGALKPMADVTSGPRPRLIDFGEVCCAVAEAMGVGADAWLKPYIAQRTESWESQLEGSPFAVRLVELVHEKREWIASYEEIIAQVTAKLTDAEKRFEHTPNTPNKFVGMLERMGSVLREFEIDWDLSEVPPLKQRPRKRKFWSTK